MSAVTAPTRAKAAQSGTLHPEVDDLPPPISVRDTLPLLVAQIRPIRTSLVLGLVFTILGTFVTLAQPLATGRVLETVDEPGRLGQSVAILAGVLVVTVGLFLSGNLLLLRVTESIVAGVRLRLVRRILGLPVAGLLTYNPGDLMTRITSDSSMIRVVALTCVVQFVSGTISIVGATVLMGVLNPFLLTVTLCALTPPGCLLLLTSPKVRTWARRTQTAMGRLGRALDRVLGMYTTVKANTAEESEVEDLSRRIDDVRVAGNRTALWRSVNTSLSMASVQVSYMVVLAAGGLLVQRDEMTVPLLVSFLMYATQLSGPVVSIATAVQQFQAGQAALERIAELEEAPLELNPATITSIGNSHQPGAIPASEVTVPCGTYVGAGHATSVHPGIKPAKTDQTQVGARLTRVRLTYSGQSRPALRSLTLDIRARGLTALVGPSGCGKSSVLRLLCRFYDPDCGEVALGGRPSLEWDLSALRRHVAYVEQEAPVVEGSVRENLLYGHPEPASVTDQDQRQALHRCAIGDRFDDLDSNIGYRGQTLSGGERQRLAIARGLLRRPKLLLLDESTSALDTSTEKLVVESLRELSEEIAVIMVAHRLATIADADEIAVLDRGRLRARGRHADLLARDDLYRSLVGEGSDGDDDSEEA